MKIVFVIFCLLLAGCAGIAPQPRGQFFASIKMMKGAFSGPTEKDTGFLFYTDDTSDAGRPFLTGYRIKNGGMEDVFGDSDSAKVMDAIAAVDLEPFDFKKEVEEVTDRLNKEAEKHGKNLLLPFAFDGAEYEIVIMTKKGRFALRDWNPGVAIEACAPYSPKIAKLKAVLDLLAQYYGHAHFGV
ncbi:MAG TPA: hypothetical protein VFB27_04075 [Opitutaceae bacterium]|nr:hypothetical protein [Opitutaceae bacterium]